MTARDRDAALALARTILPDGRVLAGATEGTVDRAEEMLRALAPRAAPALGRLAKALDAAAALQTGKRLTRMSEGERELQLRRWMRGELSKWPVQLASYLFKSTHFDEPSAHRALRSEYEWTSSVDQTRTLRQVVKGETWHDGEVVECDAVVVGTGAGGAVVAKELAGRGHAVLLLEEGDYHHRDEFTGSAVRAYHALYRNHGGVFAMGNALIPVFMGRMVGGSTTVNTATCFRTPDRILDAWCDRLDTDELSPSKMKPHFERVESFLGVETAKAEHLGGAARVVARGCDALGWRHFPVRRNAPDCDGRGVCNFGCPTDAKRSMNVTYVPRALELGAMLVTGMRAERVLVESGRAVGLEARATRGGARLVARSRVVVLAGGAVPTPVLLLGQGLANSSGRVGTNLSLHPATSVAALFDERIEGYNAIPQSYCCDEFHREGILMLGASAPVRVAALMFQMAGRRLMDAMDQYDRIANFGVMVEDEARGRVRRSRRGAPIVTYRLGRREVDRIHRGMARLAEIYVAAGARRLYPLMPRIPSLEPADIGRFRAARLRPWDFVMTSFHPLGTCPMGRDPRRSVVGVDHEAHDVPGLFITDGSTVPSAPAVNPQITIMAMATRAADGIDERLA